LIAKKQASRSKSIDWLAATSFSGREAAASRHSDLQREAQVSPIDIYLFRVSNLQDALKETKKQLEAKAQELANEQEISKSARDELAEVFSHGIIRASFKSWPCKAFQNPMQCIVRNNDFPQSCL